MTEDMKQISSGSNNLTDFFGDIWRYSIETWNVSLIFFKVFTHVHFRHAARHDRHETASMSK